MSEQVVQFLNQQRTNAGVNERRRYLSNMESVRSEMARILMGVNYADSVPAESFAALVSIAAHCYWGHSGILSYETGNAVSSVFNRVIDEIAAKQQVNPQHQRLVEAVRNLQPRR